MQALAGCQLALRQEEKRKKALYYSCGRRASVEGQELCKDYLEDGCYLCEIGPRKEGCLRRWSAEELKDSGDEICTCHPTQEGDADGCFECKFYPK